MRGSLHQNVDRFLKGAASQSSCFLPVNSVSCDGHQVTLCCHGVTQQRQMSVVDIGAVKGNDMVHFLFYRLSYSLYPKYREDFYDVIGCCSDWIDVSLTENLH